ncbi:MAG: DeoR/GlpR transcriptional regulator [Roseibium sp.]|uniref:DeoR/GlpR family DNA-binding transcription regulator n=1 Tax=Roseibium sp. TaxID=1936156 RepID=UPI001B005CCC|nr:DeoR/GlpR family DNA-binding transcription regulator [Roseibium sp.]MBO6508554.1 DeoR/GlpR transcriptional regulator [Roseibium sp.]MBO6892763.1 DeoR/GlpR transcriptional regulator [Roseibium sp.]MBO6928517.1 DeoR/GlpR transcriptional regulator [Roseibium sp.]
MLGQIDISKRQAEIADLVQKAGFASVEELADRFEVTTQTIRRDVNGLCELGILRRTHGGVEPPAPASNIHYSTRQILNLAGKQVIAKQVADVIENNQSIAFSIGTTPEIVMQALVAHDKLAIFTNNLNVAFTASINPSFQVTIAGGRLRHGDRDILGSSARAFFSNYKVDIGVFGVAGVDEDGTLLDFHEDEVSARQSILANSRKSYLVLDHSKFGRSAHVRGGKLSDVDAIFTDRPVPKAFLASLDGTKTRVFVAGQGKQA